MIFNRFAQLFTTIYGALSIAMGAFGAHGLKNFVNEEMIKIWNTAVLYQLFAALFLLILLVLQIMNFKVWRSQSAMLLGSLLFSGSLYVLVLSGIHWLGVITPIGGLLMICAWVILFFDLKKAIPAKH